MDRKCVFCKHEESALKWNHRSSDEKIMSDISLLKLWEECPECGGDEGTGKLPVRYTPKAARAAGYEVQDDDPVWRRHKKIGDWIIDTNYKGLEGSFYVVLAIPGQGKPHPTWRPE